MSQLEREPRGRWGYVNAVFALVVAVVSGINASDYEPSSPWRELLLAAISLALAWFLGVAGIDLRRRLRR